MWREIESVQATLGQERAQPSPNSVTFADSSKAYRALVLPAVLGWCSLRQLTFKYRIYTIRIGKRICKFEGGGVRCLVDYLEFHSGWNVPDWENARVPRLETVAHIHAALKFNGNLKWLPYKPWCLIRA